MMFLTKARVAYSSRYFRMFSISTTDTERERLLLFELSQSLKHNAVIVEIGSYVGASTCFLAAGVRSRSGKVYAVDTWTNRAMDEEPRDTYEDFLRNIAPLKDWIAPLRGLSTEIAPQFHEEIDLLFIDGDHSYAGVQEDLEAWLPKVKEGGIVVFHDYNWAEGVRRAVREYVVPIQVEGGRRVDSIYWTRIGKKRQPKDNIDIRVSVIIPTYGQRLEFLRDTLLSLQKQTMPAENYEILVVNNGPSEEAYSVVEKVERNVHQRVRYLREHRVGGHHARHAGAREARGEILVFVDDDMLVSPDSLKALLNAYKDPKVGCVGGKIIPKWEGKMPEWISLFPSFYLGELDLGKKRRELKWPECVNSGIISVRRPVLYEAGGFNPGVMGDQRLIWLQGDGETGLLIKIYEIDYKVVYEPYAWAYHRIRASQLTIGYFCSRAFLQGICDSYSNIRLISKQQPVFARLLFHAAYYLLKAIRYYVNSLRYREKHHVLRGRAWYWYGRGQHQLRVALSPRLYRHVLQETL